MHYEKKQMAPEKVRNVQFFGLDNEFLVPLRPQSVVYQSVD
jgi:hypothetical protein